MIVATWPGAYSPSIAPLPEPGEEREVRLVLGPPTRLRGRVTIGGEPAGNSGNRVMVRVVRKDGLPGDHYFDEEFNPSADGTFECVGLAMATYRLQAALDGIWLSPTYEVTIDETSGTEPTSVVLDIGRPGVPSVLECIDRDGNPAARATIALERPEGPLTETLWPRTLIGDGKGVIQVPPLEAGTHWFTSAADNHRHELNVPPIADGHRAFNRQTIRLE